MELLSYQKIPGSICLWN